MPPRHKEVLEEELNEFLTTKPLLDRIPLTAPWLLCDWREPRWILVKRGSKSRKNKQGEWIDVETICWDRLLPNGDRLTDPRYADLLEDVKRLVYAVRSGPYATMDRSHSQRSLADNLMALANWMILHHFDKPITFLRFSSLTPRDFDRFCRDVVYGVAGLEQWERRIAIAMSNSDHETLLKNCTADGRINRLWIEAHCHIEVIRMKSTKLLPPLLDPRSRKKQKHTYIPHRQRIREKLGNRPIMARSEVKSYRLSETRVANLLTTWRHLYKQAPAVGYLLSFDPFIDISPGRLAIELQSRENDRTPDIPPHVALHYFSAAIKWVVDYGPPLIKYLDELDAAYATVKRTRPKARFDYCAPIAFSMVAIPTTLRPLNISRFQEHQRGTRRDVIRNAPSVVDIRRGLIAASFLVVAALTARRRDEVLDLTIDCVREEYDGPDIEFGLLKGSARDILDRVTRPIPALVTLAVNLLLRLTQQARNNSKDQVIRRLLFIRSSRRNQSLQVSYDRLIYYLELFADLIDAPLLEPNEPHRLPYRWYIRPHECRRFLAMSYFWRAGKHPSLSALSWFLGHLGPTETLRYLQKNRTGAELSTDAAQATIAALRSDAGRKDVLRLKNAVLVHFCTDSLDCIEPHQLEEYLADLYARGNLNIEIHAIAELNGAQQVVALTTKEKTHGTPATR